MGIMDGQINDTAYALWIVVAMMLLLIYLVIFFMKNIFFNHKKYNMFPFLESYRNFGDNKLLLLVGAIIFYILLLTWNPTIYLSIIAISIAILAIIYMISFIMPA